MKKISGLGVSSGLASGKAVLINAMNLHVEYRAIDESEKAKELKRLDKSIEKVALEILELMNNLTISDEDKLILSTHKMIIEDPELINNIKTMIKKDAVCLEHAIYKHFEETVALFEKMENDFYAQRSSDYRDVGNRLLSHVLGVEDNILNTINKGDVLIAEDISPSMVPQIAHKGVVGLVLAKGSNTSHCAILARSMNLAAVFGIGSGLNCIQPGETLYIDGENGEVIKDPTNNFVENWKLRTQIQIVNQEKLLKLKSVPAITKDGTTVAIRNNIEFPEEIDQVLEYNAEGIGLFRTEFLFLERHELPDEEEQYKIYREIIKKAAPHPVIFRTMDIGGDKLSRLINVSQEANPNLGCRGIRLSLRHQDLFKTQLRAILRAGKDSEIKIMFPMVGTMNELEDAKKILLECSDELAAQERAHSQNYKFGIMIEVPSAALLADKFAKHCDFFSIGTNDLIQYTMAIDRNSEHVQKFYDPYNPAVLRLLKMIAEKSINAGIPCSVCGEMAADLTMTPFLLKIGITELSVNPNMTLKLKKRIRSLNLSELDDLVENTLDKTYSMEVLDYLKKI
jgi:phosphotransferase system enzyme I (PtsI)